jgi:hypothetical protein
VAVAPNEKEGVVLVDEAALFMVPPERAVLVLLLLLFIPNIPPDPLGADDEFPNTEAVPVVGFVLEAVLPFVVDGCAPKLKTLVEVLLLGVTVADDGCPKAVPGVGVTVEPPAELLFPNTNGVAELLPLLPLGAPNENGLETGAGAGAGAPNRLAPDV